MVIAAAGYLVRDGMSPVSSATPPKVGTARARRAGPPQGGAMQGEWRSRAVLVEFLAYAAALAFHECDAYQKARQVRLRSSTASVVVLDGISDT